MSENRIAVIGGGAAGYFAAIACAEANPALAVTILEGTQRPLTKVRISGGGRCNVTHHCFDPAELVKCYPRGHRELRGPLSRFQPQDTVAWFEKRGVALKIEGDGRMFPVTDRSDTVINCLQSAARDSGVEVRLGAIVKSVRREADGGVGFLVALRENTEQFAKVLIATGSAPHGYRFAKDLGHAIVETVPSLFTFKIKDPRLIDLPGISFPTVSLSLLPHGHSRPLIQSGPLLITHWGLSGPAVLKLSAWGARELWQSQYKALLKINFLGTETCASLVEKLVAHKGQHGKKNFATDLPLPLPKRFLARLVQVLNLPPQLTWANVPNAAIELLAREIAAGEYAVDGKGEFKEEFVTCGGVDLKDVDLRTMESKRCPGVFFAGEILDIDGITGGFNFQCAWTTGWIAGGSMGRH